VRILVTNDDGIDSEGLHVLALAMRAHGDVIIVAPNREFSGASVAIGPLHRIQPEVQRVSVAGIEEAWALNGTPALCVTFARLEAFGPPPDLVVSGINPGANVGRAVYHSGTVGAAITARNAGINAVAVSQAVNTLGVEGQGWDEMLTGQQWSTAATIADAVVGSLVAALPPDPVIVNLNVPNVPLDQIRGWRQTTTAIKPARTLASAVLEPKVGHEGAFYVRMNWGQPVALPVETDAGTVEQGEVSLAFLGRIADDEPPFAPVARSALERLLQRPR
jgi:5'-nucleotidase